MKLFYELPRSTLDAAASGCVETPSREQVNESHDFVVAVTSVTARGYYTMRVQVTSLIQIP